jgi:hypothetical protein
VRYIRKIRDLRIEKRGSEDERDEVEEKKNAMQLCLCHERVYEIIIGKLPNNRAKETNFIILIHHVNSQPGNLSLQEHTACTQAFPTA